MLSRTLAQPARAALRRMCTADAAATPAAKPEGYGTAVKVLHWAMAGTSLTCIATVQLQQATKDPTEKGKWMFWHKSSGLLTGLLLVPRLAARLVSKTPAALPGAFVQRLGGHLSHLSLYSFMIGMPLTGVIMGYYGGKGLPFFYTTFPGAPEEERRGDWAKQAYQLHKQAGWYFEWGFVPLHVGAVGFHMLKGDRILRRMNPFV